MLDSSPLLGALLVKCLSLLLSALDLALDLLFGWTVKGGTREERRRAEEEYDKSAQVRIIKYTCTTYDRMIR